MGDSHLPCHSQESPTNVLERATEPSVSWGSHGRSSRVGCGVATGFFAFFVGDSHRISTTVPTGFPFDILQQISTTFDHDKKSKLSTLFDTDIYRQISTFPMPNFDKFRPLQFSISLDQFRQTLYFRASHYYYMPIIPKVYLFLIDKFRSALLSFFSPLTYIIV